MKPVTGSGFVLSELLVAGLLSAFLMLGLVQMAAGAGRSLLLIESLAQTQQDGRFAISQLRDVVMPAGFEPRPWEEQASQAGLLEASADGGVNGSDVLVVAQLSDRNCYGTINSALDSNGLPDFYLRLSRVELTVSGNLAHTCHFGAVGGPMTRQINRQALVSGVESFQALFAEDTTGDRQANRMVRAGNWTDVSSVTGIQVGLMLATQESVGDQANEFLMVLDQGVTVPDDGHLRQVWTATIPLFSKLR